MVKKGLIAVNRVVKHLGYRNSSGTKQKYLKKYSKLNLAFMFNFIKSKKAPTWLFSALLLIIVVGNNHNVLANNVMVTNVEISDINTIDNHCLINFDITWENSWRVANGPSNWDACWVFCKYRLLSQSTWHHATLNYVNGSGSADGHTVPSNATIASSDDNGAGGANGVFIYNSLAQGQLDVS